ncbi:MAG TPA: T9SS type A sorting domain-containing protein, partial [Draconibacterium sp.]|nr:T9SS type A sorting domain-containing protein [Draconibacterium sp.]
IEARWKSMEGNLLAIGQPTHFYQNFEGALVPNVYYPIALAEKLSGKEITGPEDPDITCDLNKNIDWYFGTDGNTPGSKYDLVTAVLHEITHGLGFSGFFKAENGTGFFNNNNNLPSIYDYYIFNYGNKRLADDNNFNRPSNELLTQLTSEELKFHPDESVTELETTASLYAPSTWKPGSSIYHLDQSDYNTDEKNGLMTAYKYKGEAIHTPGDVTLNMLSEMGWKSISFQFEELKDFEDPCDEMPVKVAILSDMPVDSSSVKVIFSTNYFTTKDSVSLHYNSTQNKFDGNIPLNGFMGKVQYYFKATSKDNKIFKLPSTAPNKKFSLRIGPDYSPPSIQHNPVRLISKFEHEMQLTAVAEDNIGINSVKVEYKINGVQQSPVALSVYSNDLFTGEIKFPGQLSQNDRIEYRIVANDKSRNENKITAPANGYYSVNIFKPEPPVESFQSDFNSVSEDFISADFTVSTSAGFPDGALQTQHPYPVSTVENENYNLIAQLKYPVILKNGGQMTFDEIVLVEPGEPETSYPNNFFWDYVIVEGSKDKGKTWQPLTKGYDSQSNDNWYAVYTNTLKSSTSYAVGDENMYVNHTINLTDNTGFYAGDTLLFRFRLSSDQSISGWGWAIDNLNIQKLSTANDELAMDKGISVFPNPCTNNFYIDCSNMTNVESMEILVTDLMGKTVYEENWANTQFNPKKQVDLANVEPGIYLVNMITDYSTKRITKKIIKY